MKTTLYLATILFVGPTILCCAKNDVRDLLGHGAQPQALSTDQRLSSVLGAAVSALERSGRPPADYMLVHLFIDSKPEGISWTLIFDRKGRYVPPDTRVKVQVDDSTGKATIHGMLGAKQ